MGFQGKIGLFKHLRNNKDFFMMGILDIIWEKVYFSQESKLEEILWKMALCCKGFSKDFEIFRGECGKITV